MTEDVAMIYDELKGANNKSLEHFSTELLKIRAGKASPVMLQGVMVDYYGSPTPLQQVANINTMDARTISVQPWERAMLNEVMRGIINANLGFAPQSNGESLLISVPPLTEDRRRDLVKIAKAEGENAKVAVRNNRKDAMDLIKALKEDGLPEDMQKDAETEIQNFTNSSSVKVDSLLAQKEKEIMTI
ncbi:MAG: ribosome recycling factor [Fluviicola sp.]|nr:MAG: ribosome recycling factor [Fluviicola sp.]